VSRGTVNKQKFAKDVQTSTFENLQQIWGEAAIDAFCCILSKKNNTFFHGI